ncbi:hypothetical protein BGZ76_008731 [Entomortierella beljakovae]|nr:hypothetical protein BGZ76_008731 [Entomortierella beljakovae]
MSSIKTSHDISQTSEIEQQPHSPTSPTVSGSHKSKPSKNLAAKMCHYKYLPRDDDSIERAAELATVNHIAYSRFNESMGRMKGHAPTMM